MKELISYNVTYFAFGICLSEVWALKEILEAQLGFGLIRSSLSGELVKFYTGPKIYPRSSHLAICA